MGFHAKGTQIQLGDGAATEVFAAVVEMADLNWNGPNVPTAETTNHDSPAGEHVGGIPDNGEVTFSGNFLAAHATHDQTTGYLSKADGSLNNWKLIWPGATLTASFAAILTGLQFGMPHDGKQSVSGTLKISGEVAWT